MRVSSRLLLLLSITRALTAPAPVISDLIVRTQYPHDDAAFTQGLLYDATSQIFYESTGLYGGSSVRRVTPSTGEVLASRPLESAFFGEGLALWNSTLYQLTWMSRRGFMYATDAELTNLGGWDLPTTFGWGLTLLPALTAAVAEDVLLLSDGTSAIYFLDPCSLTERTELRLTVTHDGSPVTNLNELEVIEGRLWANIWLTDTIAVIDLSTGVVLFYVDCSSLKLQLEGTLGSDAVLNGIAYRPADHTLWLTGKLWPRLFEVDLSELLTTHAGLGIQVAATSQPPSCAQPGTVSPTPSLTISPTASPTPCEGGPTTLAPSLATLAPSASAPTQATLAPTASALGPACRGVDCLPRAPEAVHSATSAARVEAASDVLARTLATLLCVLLGLRDGR